MKPILPYEERRLQYLLRWQRFEQAYIEFGAMAVPPAQRRKIAAAIAASPKEKASVVPIQKGASG